MHSWKIIFFKITPSLWNQFFYSHYNCLRSAVNINVRHLKPEELVIAQPEGRTMSNDTRTCVDKDECVEWGYCEQLFANYDVIIHSAQKKIRSLIYFLIHFLLYFEILGSCTCTCANEYFLLDESHCGTRNGSSLNVDCSRSKNLKFWTARRKPKCFSKYDGSQRIELPLPKGIIILERYQN